MTLGRPIEYNETVLSKAREYLDLCIDEENEFHKTRGIKSDSYDRIIKVKLPTIEGLSLYLKISRETVYDWETKYKPFSDILEELRAMQAERLLNNGLNGDYNPIIAKLILAKHNYKEKTETDITTNGESINGFNFIRNDGKNNPDNKTN